jgi:hydroxymethylbilane synthase
MTSRILRMGTRASALAQTQSGQVARALEAASGMKVETILIRTVGDQLSSEGKAPPGGDATGVFTKALDDALREKRIDFAVHSLKDLPTAPERDLVLAAVPTRADVRDALVLPTGAAAVLSVTKLPQGARVATSSPRRVAQLLRLRPDLRMVTMAGNVDTRLRKLEEEQAEALLLACAGLDRLAFTARIALRLNPDELLPAPGQGALALVCREADATTRTAAGLLDDRAARLSSAAERSLLNELGAGCRAPVGALAWLEGETLHLRGRVLSLDGAESLESVARVQDANDSQADELGRRVASALLAAGAKRLVDAARASG